MIDDLSARITAAAFAVKEVLPNRCLLTIADTLTRLGIKRKQNAKRAETDRKDSEWDSPAVRDRVRGYEKRFANWSTKERTALTRQWITAYRLHTSFANYIDRDDQRRSI